LANDEGKVTFEGFSGFLVEITEDSTSPDQVRDSFRGVAREKPYVTELDLRIALVPEGCIDYLRESMPRWEGGKGGDGEPMLDYQRYLDEVFV